MTTAEIRDRLLDAILPHVAFDGWSKPAFDAAVAETGTDPTEARLACPRGAFDLAVHLHERGDETMARAVRALPLGGMKVRERVAEAVWLRITAIEDKEAVRRATTLFALPMHAADGAQLIWGTADAIWTALGDPSDDINWYTKRATLAAVWSSVMLYWLGDDSLESQATRAFIDRRIENVMQVEKAKAQIRQNPVTGPFARAAEQALSWVKAPVKVPEMNLPGQFRPEPPEH